MCVRLQILDRFNVAIIAKFASRQLKHKQFMVSTTHLLFNPRRDDVRIAQLQLLLAELDRMSVHTETKDPLPIILTGDFNSHQSSEPLRLLKDGHINSNNLPLHLGIMDSCQHMNVTIHENRKITGLFHSRNNEKNAKETDEGMANECIDASIATLESVHELGLAYNTGSIWHLLNLTATQLSRQMASTYNNDWVLVDYIFYTKYKRRTIGPLEQRLTFSALKLLANYELPNKQDCHAMGPIPNNFYGSDHYSIVSEFALTNR